MSGLDRKATELVEMYRTSLEQRIEQGDWNLVCKDEKLSQQVEKLLRDDRAQDVHAFPGVDPLRVMEASLFRGGPNPSRAGVAGGLDGLAKAFEVLELAALNLYLCPWRKEYRVVKVRWFLPVGMPDFFLSMNSFTFHQHSLSPAYIISISQLSSYQLPQIGRAHV